MLDPAFFIQYCIALIYPYDLHKYWKMLLITCRMWKTWKPLEKFKIFFKTLKSYKIRTTNISIWKFD